MRPIRELAGGDAGSVRFVLFDIDDTITQDGRLLESSYSAMWALRRAGFKVIPITGRPAGWCDCIARQWPVDGVVGENGAFAFYLDGDRLERLFHPAAPEPALARERLAILRGKALALVPGLRVAKDQPYRLFDLALDFAEESPRLPLAAARLAKTVCEGEGARAKISSIHVNAWYGDYDKLSMTELLLSRIFGWDPRLDSRAVVFFGDSPNDEPMFRRFPLSCGVANVRHFEALMEYPPAFVTDKEFGGGFAEGCAVILDNREGH
jgi:HAD superfamily hydrolase (TIGR01484 family)